MKRRNTTSRSTGGVLILMAASLAFAAGCASTPEAAPPAPDTGEFSDGTPAAPSTPSRDLSASGDRLNIPPVYFDLDATHIRREFEAGLRAGANTLRDSGSAITIEGHCDERGSEEYNIALGERRAGAVRQYLYNLGVPLGQMDVVSFGEARPAVSGAGETAWQLNRRAQFSVR